MDDLTKLRLVALPPTTGSCPNVGPWGEPLSYTMHPFIYIYGLSIRASTLWIYFSFF